MDALESAPQLVITIGEVHGPRRPRQQAPSKHTLMASDDPRSAERRWRDRQQELDDHPPGGIRALDDIGLEPQVGESPRTRSATVVFEKPQQQVRERRRLRSVVRCIQIDQFRRRGEQSRKHPIRHHQQWSSRDNDQRNADRVPGGGFDRNTERGRPQPEHGSHPQGARTPLGDKCDVDRRRRVRVRTVGQRRHLEDAQCLEFAIRQLERTGRDANVASARTAEGKCIRRRVINDPTPRRGDPVDERRTFKNPRDAPLRF